MDWRGKHQPFRQASIEMGGQNNFSALLCHLVVALVALSVPSGAWKDDTGFNLLYTSNDLTYQKIDAQFTNPIPAWINGSLIHNGPGLFDVNKRQLNHLFDGFAKPLEWEFDGRGHAKFSTGFLTTNSFMESMQINDVAPYILYLSSTPTFGFGERITQMLNGMDNVNINVAKIGDEYIYMTDLWLAYSTKQKGSWYVSQTDPEAPTDSNILKKYGLSSSHPLPVDASDPEGSMVNFFVVPAFTNHTIYLANVHSSDKQDFFAEIPVGPLPYMHSFGATDNYMILFAHPFYIDSNAMLQTQSAAESFVYKPEDGSTVYVANKDGSKVRKFRAESYVVTHHINAYEEDGKIIGDFITFPDPTPFLMYEMRVLTNLTARNDLNAHEARIRRFVFDLESNTLEEMSTPHFDGLANRLELPAINEKFRYRKYCYIYGVTFQSDTENFSDFRLVKRDICTGQDLSWGKPGFYPSEPWFVSTPGAIEEDDGLLFVTILDGHSNRSYLAIYDAKTLQELSRSDLPTFAPFLLHGKFFPAN